MRLLVWDLLLLLKHVSGLLLLGCRGTWLFGHEVLDFDRPAASDGLVRATTTDLLLQLCHHSSRLDVYAWWVIDGLLSTR